MSMLWQKCRRDLVGARWQIAGLAAVVAIVVALMAATSRARAMLAASRSDPLVRLNAAHLDIRCSPTLPGAIDGVRGLPGIAEAEERMVLEGSVKGTELPETTAALRILPAGGRPKIFALEVLDGRWPEAGQEAVLIDRSLARVRGVAVGDTIDVTVLDVTLRLPVVGVTLGSEYVLNPAHPDFILPIPGALAAVSVSAAAAAHLPYADRVGSLLFRFTPDADHEAVQAQVLEKLPVAILAVIPARDQPAQATSRITLNIYEIYTPTVVTVLVLVALALFVLTIARLVSKQRTQIGTLLAFGNSARRISFSLLGFAILPTVIGGVIGVLAHRRIALMLFEGHSSSIGWAPLIDPGPSAAVPMTLIACAAIAVLACLIPALATARKMPARLLRPTASRVIRQRAGRLLALTARLRDILRLPLSVVLGLGTVLRRRWATATAALALAANFAAVMAFLFVLDSHTIECTATYNRLCLDAVAYFETPQDEAALRAAAAKDWERVEPLISGTAWFELPRGSRLLRVECLEPDGWISRFPIAEGRRISDPRAAEIAFDHWTADAHGLHVGDKITCYPSYNAPEGTELTVAAILDGVSLGISFMPLRTAQEIYGLPDQVTGMSVSSTTSRAETVAALGRLPFVRSVVHMADARDHVGKTFSASRFVLHLALVLAVLVAVLFLGIMASLDASERSRDLAILRSLGWRDRSILGLCVTEVTARGYLGLILSLPAAPLLAAWVLHRVREGNGYRMPLHDPAWIYVMVIALGAVLIPLGALPALRTAATLPMRRIVRLLGQE